MFAGVFERMQHAALLHALRSVALVMVNTRACLVCCVCSATGGHGRALVWAPSGHAALQAQGACMDGEADGTVVHGAGPVGYTSNPKHGWMLARRFPQRLLGASKRTAMRMREAECLTQNARCLCTGHAASIMFGTHTFWRRALASVRLLSAAAAL